MAAFVSIIIPTHNRAKLLHRAIDSVLNQTYNNIEIIIVDDHSQDNTKEIINKYMLQNENIYYYHLPECQRGACFARNYGIEKANGEYITGLDDDDEFMPDRIEILLSKITPNYVFVFSSWLTYNSGKYRSYIYFKKEKNISKNDMLWCNYVGNQVLVRKNDIMKVGCFDLDTPCYQDWDMWLRLLNMENKALYIPKPLQILYVDNNRTSITKEANHKIGLRNIYNKNSYIMSFWQKQFFYYREYRKYGKPFSIMMFFSCVIYFFIRLKDSIKYILFKSKTRRIGKSNRVR